MARGDLLDEDALAAGMAGCELLYHVAGVNTMCPDDPAALFHANVRGAELAVRAAARAGVPRVVLTSSAAALGEAEGTVGSEDSPHRGTYLSVYERTKHEGELAAFAAARSAGVELVAINPSSVQGPGRAGGTGRILIAYLNGRLKAFVDTRHQHRRHRRLRDGPPARRRARARRRALRAQRRRDHVAARRWRSSSELSGVRHRVRILPAGRRAGRRRRGGGRLPRPRAQAARVPRDGAHAAARSSLRRLARRRASWA